MTSPTLPQTNVGEPIGLGPIASLDDLIAHVQERRVEQMLHIAFLIAEDADPAEAEDGLRQIEALLAMMRLQQAGQQS